jgi:hypothetical protein
VILLESIERAFQLYVQYKYRYTHRCITDYKAMSDGVRRMGYREHKARDVERVLDVLQRDAVEMSWI